MSFLLAIIIFFFRTQDSNGYVVQSGIGGIRESKVNILGQVVPYSTKFKHSVLKSQWDYRHDKGHRTVLPTNCHATWNDITPSNMRCPRRKIIGKDGLYNTYIGDFWHPHTDKGSEVKGFICQKTKWVSTCIETWYFSTTKETQIDEVPITKEDCLAAITLVDSGEYIEPFFPPHVCSWASTNKNSKEFVTVHEHSVVLDIYENKLMDPIFLAGKCFDKVCKTIHRNVLWVEANDNERDDFCVATAWEYSHVFADIDIDHNNNHPIYSIGKTIDSEIYGPRDLADACIIKICGIPGIRFSHGEWWGIKTLSDRIPLEDIIIKCHNGTSVGFVHNIWTPSELVGEITYRDHKCLDVLSSFLGQRKINPYELSYLVQDFPGEGPAYRIMKQYTGNNKTKATFRLQTKTCRYHVAYIDKLTFDPENGTDEVYKLGTWGNGRTVILNSTEVGINPTYINKSFDWEPLETFNGLMRFGAELVLPQAVYTDHPNITNLLEDYEISLIGHPKEIFEPEQDELSQVYKFYERSNSTNVVGLASNFVKTIGRSIGNFFGGTKNLIWWLVTVALSTIGTYIAYKLGLFKFLGRILFQGSESKEDKRVSNIYEEPLKLGGRRSHLVKNPFFDNGI
ncbi:virion transmembrane glycoprotein [Hapavirus wongabel]|uniref:Virion transmembrane glycoprotein n=1 Tax=Hapavirus wongabel TaxID=1972626 RepID=B2X7D8_9RHAB|nr:virion transmembrane glycoprotein [Hapavirus wongabel]ABV01363.1 virion transmembrane glycoprotein [Hapavirus wongabel]